MRRVGTSLGPAVSVNLTVKSLIAGVQPQNPIVPIALNIDRRTPLQLAVEARTPRVAVGWNVTKREAGCSAAPCTVTFTGPSTWETNLVAYADYPFPVENVISDVLSQPVQLEQNGQPLDLSLQGSLRTEPASTLDIANVNIHIEAVTGSSSRQVVLIDSPPIHGPPRGYRVTNISVTPVTVVITGLPDVLAKISTITLPPVDLSAFTSDAQVHVRILYPAGVSHPNQPDIATVTYSISANPNLGPSPTPT